jgi:hypothetical protein
MTSSRCEQKLTGSTDRPRNKKKPQIGVGRLKKKMKAKQPLVLLRVDCFGGLGTNMGLTKFLNRQPGDK